MDEQELELKPPQSTFKPPVTQPLKDHNKNITPKLTDLIVSILKCSIIGKPPLKHNLFLIFHWHSEKYSLNYYYATESSHALMTK